MIQINRARIKDDPTKPYVFDVDQNGILGITQKNIDFIEALIKNDSNYRLSFDPTYIGSSAYFLSQGVPTSYNDILKTVTLIDQENSTHLAVSGMQAGSNQGRVLTAQCISKIQNLQQRLAQGDPTLVNEIAGAVSSRNNFSFASKFCAYTSIYSLNADNYSIYDNVIKNILPYYAYYYLSNSPQYWRRVKGKNARNISTIEEVFRKRSDYKGYQDLIGEILLEVEAKGITITRKQFDNLLWYYFKGINNRIINAMEFLP